MNTGAAPRWGAIFDWDGVIIDSSRQHEESWQRLADAVSKTLPAGHFLEGFGRKNEFIIPEILRWSYDESEIVSLSLQKEEHYRAIVRERGLEPLPGVRAWLERLRQVGIPCVVGSSSHRENIELALQLTGLTRYFRDIVSSEDVKHGKPAPDVFLRGAEKIGLPPEKCIVFEDAHVGIAAARNAGMKVIGVATTNPIADLTKADLAVERLDEIDLNTIGNWFPAPLATM